MCLSFPRTTAKAVRKHTYAAKNGGLYGAPHIVLIQLIKLVVTREGKDSSKKSNTDFWGKKCNLQQKNCSRGSCMTAPLAEETNNIEIKLSSQIARKSILFRGFMVEKKKKTLTAEEEFPRELHDGPIGRGGGDGVPRFQFVL
jgi:hypothetical protein